MLRKIVFLTIAALVLASVLPASAAGPLPGISNTKTEVLISMSGGTDALAAYLQNNGGVVRIKYQNVPVLAAEVPVLKLGEIASFPGVLSVTKNVKVALEPNPLERFGVKTRMPLAATQKMKAIAPQTIQPSSLPAGFVNYTFTGADQVWQETDLGSGSIIAVLDTGVTPIPCLEQAVIGAPGFPDGFNATGDGISPTDPQNDGHGTFVSFVAAASCALSFSDASDPLWQAIHAYQPQYTMDYVPLFGQAPGAKIYPVKVFSPVLDTYWEPVLTGLDHVITLKKSGALDIDIVNMSLAYISLQDGKDIIDRFVEATQAANILVVAAAANYGPTPNTVGTPAASYAALSVGALDYGTSSRIFYEWLGLTNSLGAGTGMAMRSTGETRLASFSSRGPLSDGRLAPEITALGWPNFGFDNQNYWGWGGGTSFASPTVAGGAALLNAWWEAQGQETDPVALENALLKGANPNEVGPEWRRPEDQGYGVLDIPAALAVLKSGDLTLNEKKLSQLKANILGMPVKGKTETWSSGVVSMNPSQFYDLIFEISPDTSRVTIEVSGIAVPDNSATTVWPNGLYFNLQSADRSAAYPPIYGWIWWPYWDGGSFTITVEDGQWIVDSQYGPWPISSQQMEPGLMKLSLGGDMVNDSPVSFNVLITRENYAVPKMNRIANGLVKPDDMLFVPVQIPAGTSQAVFDLVFHRDWSKFPTSDVDLWIFDPDGNLASTEGVNIHAPERATLDNPVPGTWTALVWGSYYNNPDNFDLYLTLK